MRIAPPSFVDAVYCTSLSSIILGKTGADMNVIAQGLIKGGGIKMVCGLTGSVCYAGVLLKTKVIPRRSS